MNCRKCQKCQRFRLTVVSASTSQKQTNCQLSGVSSQVANFGFGEQENPQGLTVDSWSVFRVQTRKQLSLTLPDTSDSWRGAIAA